MGGRHKIERGAEEKEERKGTVRKKYWGDAAAIDS